MSAKGRKATHPVQACARLLDLRRRSLMQSFAAQPTVLRVCCDKRITAEPGLILPRSSIMPSPHRIQVVKDVPFWTRSRCAVNSPSKPRLSSTRCRLSLAERRADTTYSLPLRMRSVGAACAHAQRRRQIEWRVAARAARAARAWRL